MASTTGTSGSVPVPVAAVVGYGVGGLALLALADPAPRLATTIVVVLIVAAVLARSEQVAVLLQNATGALDTLTNHPQSS